MTKADIKVLARVLVKLMQEHSERMRYRGVYGDAEHYLRGNFVTHQGSLWHCNIDSPKAAPGAESGEWSLAVKRGKAAPSNVLRDFDQRLARIASEAEDSAAVLRARIEALERAK